MTEIFEHHHVRLNGLNYHFVTGGAGPAVLLLHGFPDLWLGWRPVMERLVKAGFFVVAPDLRGFGETEAVTGVDQVTGVDVMGDLICLLDHLNIPNISVVAHDWGAEIGWTIVRLRPDRFRAIVALSVPYAPRGPDSVIQMMRAVAPPDLYMLYFLEEGRAEEELDKNPEAFLSRLFYSNWGKRPDGKIATMRVADNGRLIDGLDEPPSSSNLLSDEELKTYVAAFARTGFRPALNTYRSLHRNWELLAGWSDRSIEVPAFYIGGSQDIVLHMPGMRQLVEAMPALLPSAVPPVIFDGVGHFIQIEEPQATADVVADFLHKLR